MSAASNAPEDKAEVQARFLQENLASGGQQVVVARSADGGIDYLYRAGEILVKDAYLDRVRAALSPTGAGSGPLAPQDSGLIEGVTLLSLAPYHVDVPGALEVIDAQVGDWVATP